MVWNEDDNIFRDLENARFIKKDLNIAKELRNEISNFDIPNFITRVAALHISPKNQNKGLSINTILGVALSIDKSKMTSKLIMSQRKFRDVVKKFEALSNYRLVDPPENPFIERVLFGGNYYVFPGIHHYPAFSLQTLLRILWQNHSKFPNEFYVKSSRLLKLILNLSTDVANELLPNYLDIEIPEDSNSIYIPSSYEHNKLVNLITLNESYFNFLLDCDERLALEMHYDYGSSVLENSIKLDQEFFCKPFIKISENKILILDITVLSSLVVHKSIILSKKLAIDKQFFELYNENIWRFVVNSLKKIGHKIIDAKQFQIELVNDLDYKEKLLLIGNKKILYLTCCFDVGENYSEKDLFGKHKDHKLDKKQSKQMDNVLSKLSKVSVKKEDILCFFVFSSFGRVRSISLKNYFEENIIVLSPYEVKCISINQINQPNFLWKYLRNKIKLKNHKQSYFIGELNYIQLYVENDNSYYLQDDFNTDLHYLYISSGEALKYILRAVKNENRQIVESYKDDQYTEIIRFNDSKYIYIEDFPSGNKSLNFLLFFKSFKLWIFGSIYNEKQLNLYSLVSDIFTYWISKVYEVFDSVELDTEYITLEVIFSGEEDAYYLNLETDKGVLETIEVFRIKNRIKIVITPETFYCLNHLDNSVEKELVTFIINIIINPLKLRTEQLNILNKLFLNANNKKFYVLEAKNVGFFKDLIDFKQRKIEPADINIKLDEIGRYILAQGKWSIGLIPDTDRVQVSHNVVTFLYNSLAEKLSKLSSISRNSLIELTYSDLEKTTYQIYVNQKMYGYNLLSYPEKNQEIFNEINELNKMSISLKFLLEYLAATTSEGKEILDLIDYDEYLATSYLITDWGYKKDLFQYKIINTKMEILSSKRIGIKSEEFLEIDSIVEKVRSTQLNSNSQYRVSKRVSEKEILTIEGLNFEHLDQAFIEEFGYSFRNFSTVVWSLVDIGEEQGSLVSRTKTIDLVIKVTKEDQNISPKLVNIIVDNISLRLRSEFLEPGEPFTNIDVYPWRFNRELSLTRRPVIFQNDLLLWGNRSVVNMFYYLIDLINDGKLKSKSSKMKELKSTISTANGKAFNNFVFERIKTIQEFRVFKNVRKINRKKIEDEARLELGDIDVLYIYDKKRKIVVVETKNFNFSRNPYEIHCEYTNMFDDKSRKSYVTKHKRREEWVRTHLNDLRIEYDLKGDGWCVSRMFIVSEHLISNDIYTKNEKIITASEINLKNLL